MLLKSLDLIVSRWFDNFYKQDEVNRDMSKIKADKDWTVEEMVEYVLTGRKPMKNV